MWGDGFLRKGGFAFSITSVRTGSAPTGCSWGANGLGVGRQRRFWAGGGCLPFLARARQPPRGGARPPAHAISHQPPPPFRKNPVGWRRRFGEGGVKKSEFLVYLCC